MSAHSFAGDSYTPFNSFRGMAGYGRTSAGVWTPILVDSTGKPQVSVVSGDYFTHASQLDLTMSLDTSAYASGDLIADTQELADAFPAGVGTGILLDSVRLIDQDDQGVKLYVVFLNAATSLGTENSAPNISDADALTIIGTVTVLTTDYLDLGGVKYAQVRGLAMPLKAAAADDSLYVAIVNDTGTPTYTASGLKLQLGIRY